MNAMVIASGLCVVLAVISWRGTLARRLSSAAAAFVVFQSFFLSGLYLSANELTGAGIDESVLFHLWSGTEGAAYVDFSTLIILSVAGFVAILVTTALTYRMVRSVGSVGHRVLRQGGGVLAMAMSFALNPAVPDLYRLAETIWAPEQPAPPLYVDKRSITFDTAPRNFVILYVESLERTYFDENIFPGLMPNLSALEKSALSFTDISEVYGTGWSIAGVTAGLCGIPLVGPGANNSMVGMDRFLPGATCMGDVLKAKGYRLDHMMGADLNFAGSGNFFRTHGFDMVEGRDELKGTLTDPEYLSPWGLYDDSLFTLAEERFDTLAAAGKPFGLVVSTVDTHHPSGNPSRSCEGIVYGDGSNPILNTVHCADLLVAEFAKQIMSKKTIGNTVLAIASDHLAMPNTAWDLLTKGKRRDLMMFLGDGIAPRQEPKPGMSLDFTPTLLGLIGAKVEGFGFGRNLAGDGRSLIAQVQSIEDLLYQSTGFLAAMWSFPQISKGIHADTGNERLLLGGRSVRIPALLYLDDAMRVERIAFDFFDEKPLPEIVAALPFDQRFVWVDSCPRISSVVPELGGAGPYCVVYGALGADALVARALSGDDEVSFAQLATYFDGINPTPENSTARAAAIDHLARLGTREVIEYVPQSKMVGDFALHSAGFGNGASAVTNLDTGDRVELVRGLSLLGLNAGSAPVKLGHIDSCAFDGTLVDKVELDGTFATAIAANADRFGGFAIVSHDSATCSGRPLAPLFAGSGLTRWAEIGFRMPYVAVFAGNGDVAEYLGDEATALTIEARDFLPGRDRTAAPVKAQALPVNPG